VIDPEDDGPMGWALRQTTEYQETVKRRLIERANETARQRIAELERELEHSQRTFVPMMSITEDQATLIKSVARIRDLELSISWRDGQIMVLEAERDGLNAACEAYRRELAEMRRALATR